jgi:hypothetical protein
MIRNFMAAAPLIAFAIWFVVTPWARRAALDLIAPPDDDEDARSRTFR